MAMRKPVFIVGGATGVGKSDFAIRLAQRISGEVISCDSVQVYKGLNIGSNKTVEFHGVPHHLIDILDDPSTEEFSAAAFFNLAMEKIDEIHNRGNVPLLVGGTNFYISWFINGRPQSPPSDPEISTRIFNELKSKDPSSWDACLERLKKIDAKRAKALNPNDFYRLGRALVITEMNGGREIDDTLIPPPPHLSFLPVYLCAGRVSLYRDIDRRCEAMVASGLLQEVLLLIKDGKLKEETSAGRAIGYSQSIKFIRIFKQKMAQKASEQKELYDEFIDEMNEDFLDYLKEFMAASRQLARKQDSLFFTKIPNSLWLFRHTKTKEELFSLAEHLAKVFAEKYDSGKSSLDDWWKSDQVLATSNQLGRRQKEDTAALIKETRTYQPNFCIYNDKSQIEELLKELKKIL